MQWLQSTTCIFCNPTVMKTMNYLKYNYKCTYKLRVFSDTHEAASQWFGCCNEEIVTTAETFILPLEKSIA